MDNLRKANDLTNGEKCVNITNNDKLKCHVSLPNCQNQNLVEEFDKAIDEDNKIKCTLGRGEKINGVLLNNKVTLDHSLNQNGLKNSNFIYNIKL